MSAGVDLHLQGTLLRYIMERLEIGQVIRVSR
jgi:hypothetical protein